MRLTILLVCALGAFAIAGCRATQLGADQKGMREMILTLYEDQVLDNLVRARESRPMLQMDYSDIGGTIEQDASIEVDRTGERDNEAGKITKKLTVVPKVTAAQKSQLTVKGEPVNSSPVIYDLYVDAAKDQKFLVALGPKDKMPKAVYRSWKGEKATYYVPDEDDCRARFLKLYLLTTVQRPDKVTVKVYFETTVDSVAKKDDIIGAKGKVEGHRLLLELHDKIINDSGEMTVTLFGQAKHFSYKPDPDADPGTETSKIVLVTSPMTDKEYQKFTKELADKPVKMKDDNYARGYDIKQRDPLQTTNWELQRIRLDQFGQH